MRKSAHALVMLTFLTIPLSLLFPVKGMTWVEGHITQDTVWKLQDSPFVVINNIIVDVGSTLTIEPGVEVKFGGAFYLSVRGNLSAIGTSAGKIRFTSNKVQPVTGDWLYLEHAGDIDSALDLRYVRIEYSTSGLLLNTTGPTVVENCEIMMNKDYGINIMKMNATLVTDCIINSNGKGIAGRFSTRTLIEEATIVNNVFSSNNEDGIDIEVARAFGMEELVLKDIVIANNQFYFNGFNGISLQTYNDGGAPVVQNLEMCDNIIGLNGGAGISIMTATFGRFETCSIIDNEIYGNAGTGISFGTDYAGNVNKFIISQNTLDNNLYGIAFAPHGNIGTIGNGTISLNNITNTKEAGITFRGFGSYHCSVGNLSISNNILITAKQGIHVDEYMTADFSISGNYIEGCSEAGLYLDATSGDLEVISNGIRFGEIGIQAEGAQGTSIYRILNNTISNNTYGIMVTHNCINIVQHNNIYDNTYGMQIGIFASLADARYNYWGDSTGPYHISMNPGGTCNPVNGNGADLLFIPFLTSPAVIPYVVPEFSALVMFLTIVLATVPLLILRRKRMKK